MKNFILKLIIPITTVIVLLQSCGTKAKLNTLKPEPNTNKNIAYVNQTSYVGLPIEIALTDIESSLNKNLVGLIYHDSVLNDDGIEMKIWKQKSISLKSENGKIHSELPLKIWVKYKYGTDFLGLNDTKEFHLNGIISLLSDVSLSNWHLKTTSNIKNLFWNESPTVQIGGKNLSISYLINPALNWFKKDIAKTIDEAIYKSCDFKPQVIKALKTLSEPQLANELYETWLTINPIEVYATDAILKNKTVIMDLGMKCTIQTLIGNKPKSQTKWENLGFKKVTKMPKTFTGTIAAITTYESASRVITNNFKGQTFSSGNKKIIVEKVDIWNKDENLIIALTMNGTISGTIYLSGIPKYDNLNQEIYFENLDYVLNTKNVLHKSANWLLSNIILNKIKTNCKYKITEDLVNARANLQPYLNNYSPLKGVFVNGTLEKLDFEKFELQHNAIVSFIKTEGKVSLKINGFE